MILCSQWAKDAERANPNNPAAWSVRPGRCRFANGNLAEVFLFGPKIGTDVQAAVRDSSIVASLALRFGCQAETIGHAIGRNSDGTAAGPLGKLLDILAKERGS